MRVCVCPQPIDNLLIEHQQVLHLLQQNQTYPRSSLLCTHTSPRPHTHTHSWSVLIEAASVHVNTHLQSTGCYRRSLGSHLSLNDRLVIIYLLDFYIVLFILNRTFKDSDWSPKWNQSWLKSHQERVKNSHNALHTVQPGPTGDDVTSC